MSLESALDLRVSRRELGKLGLAGLGIVVSVTLVPSWLRGLLGDG